MYHSGSSAPNSTLRFFQRSPVYTGQTTEACLAILGLHVATRLHHGLHHIIERHLVPAIREQRIDRTLPALSAR